MRSYIWSTAVYGSVALTLRKGNQKYLEGVLSMVLEKGGEGQLYRSHNK